MLAPHLQKPKECKVYNKNKSEKKLINSRDDDTDDAYKLNIFIKGERAEMKVKIYSFSSGVNCCVK